MKIFELSLHAVDDRDITVLVLGDCLLPTLISNALRFGLAEGLP